jgi:hypothetical protein
MAEWFFLERVVADRERDLADHLARLDAFRPVEILRERPVLSAGLDGWSWPGALRVAALVGLAVAGTIALPMGLVGIAWALGAVARILMG